jgi:FkbH-like protein
MMMNWLPTASDFNGNLRAALDSPEPTDGLEKLASLAQHRLGFLETLQLDRALNRLTLKSVSGFSQIRLAILASSTVDHLLPAIRVAGLRRMLLINAYVGAYGQYRQELLDPASSLHEFAPQLVLFSLTAREAIAGVPITATAEEVEETIARSVDELRALWRKARGTFKATVIQQTYLDVTQPLFGSYDRLVPAVPTRIIARASERDGIDAWFDAARWLQGKLEIAPRAAPLYGELVARIVAAQRGLSKKCLVLDLDNTLWAGVVGDDGFEGIVLGEGSASGEAHLALQRYAKQLKERGVILAVCSKNDPATAEAVFREHPEMILKRPDFAAFVANWDDKVKNLKLIAAQLNIGIDSLVFVDDSPVERARIRQTLPMVAVPELPEDAADYVSCLARAGYFEAVAFTSEDAQRAEQYAANVDRQTLLGSSESMDDFLRGLDMSVVFGPFTEVDLSRITQLINKTNQFNPTTRRYAAEEVASLAAAPENITLQFRLLDRFGDNGIVSAIILRPDPDQSDVLQIDCWVMSCRVFGRQLEFEAMNIAVEAARRRGGVRAFRADYVPTTKNRVVSELYKKLGFPRIDETIPMNGATRWSLNLVEYVNCETHIARADITK